MAVTLNDVLSGIYDRVNAATDEFWQTANFLLYTKDFLRRTDVREACWHQARDATQTTVAGQREYTLPNNFWHPEAVYWVVDGTEVPLAAGSLGSRNVMPVWLVRGNKLWLEPAPTTDQDGLGLVLYYIRTPTLPLTAVEALDMPDDLAEALGAYLMGRAYEKAGPEMRTAAMQYHQEAQGRIGQVQRALGDSRGDSGFAVKPRW